MTVIDKKIKSRIIKVSDKGTKKPDNHNDTSMTLTLYYVNDISW